MLATESAPIWDGTSKTLLQLGYKDAGLDDCYQLCGSYGPEKFTYHNPDKKFWPEIDPAKFTNMTAMTAVAHTLGLTAGWYANNCACGDHCKDPACFAADVDFFVSSGFDSIKLDGCGKEENVQLWRDMLNRCLIEPSDNFDFSVFGKGTPLNPKNELLVAHLCGDEDFEEQLVEYHSRAEAKKPKADPKSISSSRTLAGQSGDRKRKREGGENGDHQRKGGDRMQQQAAGREGGRAGDVEDKRGAGQTNGLARGAAARRRRGQDDDATIAATANISRFSSVRDRVEKANGMTVIQAIELNIYTLRTLRSDKSAGCIALVRTSDRIPDPSVRDTDGDDLLGAEIHMDGTDDFFMSHMTDDFSD